jgi:Ca2+-binding EF-hand superfamily protein
LAAEVAAREKAEAQAKAKAERIAAEKAQQERLAAEVAAREKAEAKAKAKARSLSVTLKLEEPMVNSLGEPWALLPCSNSWQDEDEFTDVQLNGLSWSPTPAKSWGELGRVSPKSGQVRPLNWWEMSQSGSLSITLGSLASQSSRCSSVPGSKSCPITQFVTFSQTTLLPSVLWARSHSSSSTKRMRTIASKTVGFSKPDRTSPLHRPFSEPSLFPQNHDRDPRRYRRMAKDKMHPQSSGQAESGVERKSSRVPEDKRRSRPYIVPREFLQWQSERELRFYRLYKAPRSEEDTTRSLSRKLASPKNGPKKSASKENQVTQVESSPSNGDVARQQDSGSSGVTRESFLQASKDVHQLLRKSSIDHRSKKGRRSSVLSSVTEKNIQLVFWKLANGSSIARDRLMPALKILGYQEKRITNTDISWCVNKVAYDQSSNFDFTQFEEFCRLFDKDYTIGALKSFRDADIDGNGVLSAAEVQMLLEDHGITVIPGILKDLLDEIGLERPGSVCLAEWGKLVHIIRSRGGFTEKETKELLEIFQRYDFDGNGTIDRSELLHSLNWVAFVKDPERRQHCLAECMREFDYYGGGDVLEPEFFQLLRKFREVEIATISHDFSNHADGTGVLELDGVLALLSDAGYKMPSAEVVLECARDLGVPAEEANFSLTMSL